MVTGHDRRRDTDALLRARDGRNRDREHHQRPDQQLIVVFIGAPRLSETFDSV